MDSEVELFNRYLGKPPSWGNILIKKEDDFILAYIKEKGQYLPRKPYRQHFTHDQSLFDELDMNNLAIAGGSISSIYFDKKLNGRQDFDFWLIGLDSEQALKKLCYLVQYFVEKTEELRKKVYDVSLRIVRTENAITFSWNGCYWRSIQVNLLLARDPLEVLLSFDLAPAKIALYNGHYYMTPSFYEINEKQNKEYSIGRETLQTYSGQLANRILKYKNRGFVVRHCIDELKPFLDSGTDEKEGYYFDIDRNEFYEAKRKELDHNLFYRTMDDHIQIERPDLMIIAVGIRKKIPKTIVGFQTKVYDLAMIWFFLQNADLYNQYLAMQCSNFKKITVSKNINFQTISQWNNRIVETR